MEMNMSYLKRIGFSAVNSFFLLLSMTWLYGQETSSYIPDEKAFAEKAEWLKKHTANLVDQFRDEYSDGRTVFWTDAEHHYGLLFTRDFGYFVEFAGDLMTADETKGYLEFILEGQRKDGCIPDRVNADGVPIYSPGSETNQLADHALENASFLATAFCRYVLRNNDYTFFKKHEKNLKRGLDHIHRAENGLVYNDPSNPKCVYGYTDIVKKTGHLLMSSALYYESCLLMAEACDKAGVGNPQEYRKQARLIKENIGMLWDKDTGAFHAADGLCKQNDVWGTAFVLSRGLAEGRQKEKAQQFLVKNYDRYIQKGQVRHLLEPETWEEIFEFRPGGYYQNGGYWATPLSWLVPVLDEVDPGLAKKTLNDCLDDFRERGIHEWVNGGVTVLPDFFNSAISVYSLVKEQE